jgi:hypothetical protein
VSAQLVHYSAEPLTALRDVPVQKVDEMDYFKPRGLWVSDDACENNWRWWCEAEGFRLDALAYAHDVAIKPDANILLLGSSNDIDEFTERWHIWPFPGPRHSRSYIDWPSLRSRYAGIVITPYIWERRLSMGSGPDAMWYYSWDCASGCIWDVSAIASATLRTTKEP